MGRGLINGKVDAVEPCLRDGCEITIAFCTKYVPKPIPTLPSTTVSSSMVRCGKQQGLSQNATRRRGGAAARAGCAVSSYARLRRGGRATSNSVMSCGVVPVWTRSATISPTTGTNLNPWPEKPQASTTWGVPPSGPRSEEHTSELQSHSDLVCRLLLEKKKKKKCEQKKKKKQKIQNKKKK